MMYWDDDQALSGEGGTQANIKGLLETKLPLMAGWSRISGWEDE